MSASDPSSKGIRDNNAPDDGGFGALFKACLEYERHLKAEPLTMTDFIQWLSKETNIAERSLWRFRRSKNWPSPEILRRLENKLESLKGAASDSASARGRWEVVEKHQEKMEPGTMLVILSATEAPKAFSSKEIAYRLAVNVLEKNFRYFFIYPPHGRLEISPTLELKEDYDDLKQGLIRCALLDYLQTKDKPLDRFMEYLTRLGESVSVCGTNKSHWSWSFWGCVPRYTVMYNAFSGGSERHRKFGMFWERGLSAYILPTEAGKDSTTLEIQGWTYLDQREAKVLFNMLENKEILEEKTMNQMREHWGRIKEKNR